MTRMLPLAALALACLAAPALAAAVPPETCADCPLRGGNPAHGLGFGLVLLAGVALAVGAGVALVQRLPIAGVAVLMLLALAGSAFAAEVATAGTTAVIIPWGDYIVAAAQMLTSILVPFLTALIMGVVAKLFPIARMFITEALVERTLQKWFDYGVNATRGATKDATVSVPVGSAIVASALQRGVVRADASTVSKWVMDKAGGPVEVAHKLFRMLKLEEGGTAAAVVEPALDALSGVVVKR
ncbi:hypothetical protein [Methylobacterium sp. WSM2598]|uniref:hypothetical protein n=1 Tax=Methylobacterium sp. WSM2598 TaxID=398261 RepID=UPI00037F0387|nr:hypothetical protein [Methylobacterium sp. WSM2598]